MKYFSLHNKENTASFKEAVINGIAPDKGLYFPFEIPKLDKDFMDNFSTLSRNDLAFELIKPFVGNDIPAHKLQQIIAETLSFDFPLIELENNNYILELFHGPTLAFKDVGARFMARCLGYFNEGNKEKVCVLVATSGDTGGAVADGFYGVEGVDVVILYPKGRVSAIQEKQLTTFGGNIQAVEVNGSFDDCQAMVKTAFLDKEITSKLKLTSANSINVARWLPQMFYYAFALQELIKQGKKQFVFSVPSGNFGNICAAFMLKKMGLSIKHLIAACNANDVIPQYMKTGILEEKVSVSTISNAMDVALPSNFVRIMELYNGNLDY
ncbi:MAG: threonine synthase [Chitinophagales bacterium]